MIHLLKRIILILFLLLSASPIFTQETGKPYKLIAGARVNPLLIYDFDGNNNETDESLFYHLGGVLINDFEGTRSETVRLHGEIGLSWNKKWYFSAGYTPFTNSFYTFNEYWFIGKDKKLPVSLVASAEWDWYKEDFILQSGPNIKLKGGNVFAFLFTPADKINWGLKIGAFIPLNVVLKKN